MASGWDKWWVGIDHPTRMELLTEPGWSELKGNPEIVWNLRFYVCGPGVRRCGAALPLARLLEFLASMTAEKMPLVPRDTKRRAGRSFLGVRAFDRAHGHGMWGIAFRLTV